MAHFSHVRRFLLGAVAAHPRDLVDLAARRFKLSRQGVHKHLQKLIDGGEILRFGTRRGAQYLPAKGLRFSVRLAVRPSTSEAALWDAHFEPTVKAVHENVLEIAHYGVTEMINNVVDHSGARHLWLSSAVSGNRITITIRDDGIGIFRKIEEELALAERREAVLHL